MSILQLQNLLIRANRDNKILRQRLLAYEDLDEINAELLEAITLIKTEAEEYVWPEEACKNIELTCIAILNNPKE